jgi:hypothetical protein
MHAREAMKTREAMEARGVAVEEGADEEVAAEEGPAGLKKIQSRECMSKWARRSN